MRQRGADVTDIVVLVVAADDGVMPQTKESIRYAKKAGSPIIVAVNKMDKEGATPDRVKQELTEFELVSEDWGGDTMFVPISALKGDGIDDLLEAIKLQAEMMDLREDDKGAAEGMIIESKIETGRGAVATVLVQKGTLKKGDAVVCGENYGRARSLMDTTGKTIQSAGPSIPVQILGFNTVPSPGDTLNVIKNEREAKKVVDNRIAERQKLENAKKPIVASLEDFFAATPIGDQKEKKILNLIVRSDVQGSYEAIRDAVETIGNDEVGVEVLTGGVGAITDNDVQMANNANGYLIGFNMRPVTSARKMAENLGVEVRTYSIIYELINDVTMAVEGMLEPEKIEKYIGRAEVRDTFTIPKIGTVAGSAVIDGKIERGCNIRLLREGKIMYDGKLSTLKRFKDEVKEVSNGYECGMALEGYDDIKTNDLIEAYLLEEKKRKLESDQTF
jgi:translation initiation factor IF-2